VDDNWSESEIVRGLQNGDSNAWAALCSQYSDRLLRYVSRLIGNNDAAVADVFQETLLAVARAGRALSDGSTLWAWLSAIGHNQCALHWRQRARTATELLVDECAAVDPDDLLIQHETVIVVRLLLAEMPSDYVTVLTSRFADGMSANDIAAELGEEAEAVRSRLARAKKDFRKRYDALTKTKLVRKES
jgi:RNA polymerase sigma-70 factor (ECF subfamily)